MTISKRRMPFEARPVLPALALAWMLPALALAWMLPASVLAGADTTATEATAAACVTSAPTCVSTCAAPAGAAACGASSCGAPDVIPRDPVTSLAARTGTTADDLGLVDLEPLLEPIRSYYNVPGIAAALVQDGEIAAIGTAGVRRAGSSARVELDDAFHIGSCGKAFTATAAAALVDREAIEWTTTIARSFPELAPSMDERFRDVTLRELLAHRAGFPGRDDAFDRAIAGFDGPIRDQRARVVQTAAGATPALEPGSAFQYTDIGYTVGGAMLERADSRSWESLVRELVAKPLGLASFGYGAPGIEDPGSAARGHLLVDGELVSLGVGPGEDLANPAIGPAGTIHLGIGDWARFARLHLRGARGEPTDLVSPESFRALHGDPFEQGYGLGWVVTGNPWGEGRALTHTGSCGAWSAVVWILPETNAAIVAASNYGGGSGFAALQLAVDNIGERFLQE